jgi:U3 small nucleolar RNA-associated protein 14
MLLPEEELTRCIASVSPGDDVEADFAAEKAAEIDGELPKVEEVGVLPGWGVWADQQQEPRWVREQKEKQAR